MFLADLERHTRRLLRSHRWVTPCDHDDLVQAVLLKAWQHRDQYGRRYPRTGVLAAVLLRSAREDHARSMRVQQGQGARLVADGEGGRRTARERLSLEVAGDGFTVMPHPLVTSLTLRQGLDPVGDTVAHTLDTRSAAHRVQLHLRLTTRDQALVCLVDGLGFSVTEAAARVGVARETANRRIVEIRRAATALGPANFAVGA